MQNNQNNSGKFRRLIRQNAPLFLLLLCVAAVGVSGYVFVRSALANRANDLLGEEVSLSVPVKPDEGKEPPEKQPDATLDLEGESIPQTEPSVETSVDAEPQAEPEPPHTVVVRPVVGEMMTPHSTDRLIYCSTMRDWRTHDGIDLAAQTGTQVRAAMSGTVSAVYDDDFLGTVVELTHPNGQRTLYGNLTEMPTVSVGDSVMAGDVIGAVGATALGESAEAPHLHFALYHGQQSLDPGSILP